MDDLHDLRMVVQHLGFSPAFRITLYGDDWKPTHADFEDEQALIQALQSSLPEFDTSVLCLDFPRQGSILFAGRVEIDDRQAKLLRLAKQSNH